MLNLYIVFVLSQVIGPSIGRKMKKDKEKKKDSKKSKAACSAVGVEDTQGGIWFGMDFYPKTQGPPIFMANDYFMKVNDIGDMLMGSEGHPTPVMQYRAGYSETGCENGLSMVRHTAMFYSEESLLEYLNGETKSMVEELAAMQDNGHAWVIRRHNEISEDTETLFRTMHPALDFKFMDIIAGFTKNKVVDMNGVLEASDDGMRINLMSSSEPCAVDGTVRSNHFDDPQGALGMFIHKNVVSIEEKNAYLEDLGEILENYMEMPVQISWIIAEDPEDELDMYEVFMFNTVENEGLHVLKDGLPGWQPAATGNRPSLTIALDMHGHLDHKNTSVLESLTRGKTVTPYLNGFMATVGPLVGDGESTYLDFTSFVAGFNANEWVLFNP